MKTSSFNRRDFLKTAVAGAGLLAVPYINCGKIGVARPMKRMLGRTGFETTTIGLGGQASVQWTPHDVDPEKIGRNYYPSLSIVSDAKKALTSIFNVLKIGKKIFLWMIPLCLHLSALA